VSATVTASACAPGSRQPRSKSPCATMPWRTTCGWTRGASASGDGHAGVHAHPQSRSVRDRGGTHRWHAGRLSGHKQWLEPRVTEVAGTTASVATTYGFGCGPSSSSIGSSPSRGNTIKQLIRYLKESGDGTIRFVAGRGNDLQWCISERGVERPQRATAERRFSRSATSLLSSGTRRRVPSA
jgi:hypothetical protein